jgi:putative ABC transport system permease protein
VSILPPGVRRAFRLARRRPRIEEEVDAEIAFHLEMRAAELSARGLSSEAARVEARRRFGDVDQWSARMSAVDRERAAGERRTEWLSDAGQDLRFALRAWRRAPLFALLAVVTLALGIGANAAVFGVVKSVLLDALPYADADRLVRVYARFEASKLERSSISPGAAADIAARMKSFARAGSFNFSPFDLAYVDEAGARVLTGASVAGDYFATLGVRPALGRALGPADGPTNHGMLSHAAWQREFGGDPGVLGRTIRIERQPIEIVGVLPRGYVGPMGEADLVFQMDLASRARARGGRDQHYLGVVGRLARGVTPAAAQRELDRLAGELAREHPQTDHGRTFVALPLRDSLVGDTRTPLLVLMASAGLVLLITCANLAGALLSRTISRRKEFAVRVSLGARRGRLVRQLLTESTLLSLAGAAVGLGLALAGLSVLRRLALPELPPYADLSLDRGAVLVTLLAALVTGLAFGLAPALSAGRSQPQGMLRESTRGTSEGRRSRQLRGLLVSAQIALSLSLLVGAGLLVRSLWAMANAPLGFEPAAVLTARVQLPPASYRTPAERSVFFRQLHERLAALPGVRGVASVTQIPSPTMSSNVLAIEGRTLEGDGPTFIPYMAVSDDYFALMAIRLRAGRVFGPEDGPDAPPAIVISETMARRYWPNGNALGARVRISPHTAERWGVVVGVVNDVRVDPALPVPAPLAYATNRQDDLWNGRDFLLKTRGDPLALLPAAQRALASLDPAVPLRNPQPLQAIVDERLAGRRLPVLLMTAFGALALLLASVGIYALFAAMAAAREREFGVRVALGSTRGDIAALVVRQGGAWMALGLAGGVVGITVVARFVAGLLYGVRPFDPVALGIAVAVLVASAAVALVVPVRRAMRADPIQVLR